MSEIKVETKIFQDRIEQSMLASDDLTNKVYRHVTKVLELESEQLQQALCKVGWLSPEKKEEIFRLLELAINQLMSSAPDAALSTIRNIINNGS